MAGRGRNVTAYIHFDLMERLDAHIEANKIIINSFVRDAIQEKLNRDTDKKESTS